MDKNTISFIVLCISIVLIVLGIYLYNNKKYTEISTMVVVPIEETSVSETEYIYTTTSKRQTYLITKAPKDTTTVVSKSTTDTSTTKITTTTIKETSASTSKSKSSSSDSSISISFPISLNEITCEELTYIDGIGTKTAQKIIDYRNAIGYFTSRYQLLEINGIGESKMNTIMQYTFIEDEDLNYNQDSSVDNEEYQEYDVQNDDYYNNEDNVPQDIQNSVEYPINLNTATLEELCSIPNVDTSIAQEILSLRDTIQYFSNPYELLYTDSISEDFLSQIIDYICVE